MILSRDDSFEGCLLGTAVGDALGLPYENVSKRRARKLLGPPDKYRFVFGRGMVSDDTEHSCMVAQALIEAPQVSTLFQKRLAIRMRRWFFTFPAGIGLATLRSMVKYSCGVPLSRCGVFSAGNGPAMRSAIIGVAHQDLAVVADYVKCSTEISHSDPKASYGALAVALAANIASQQKDIQPAAFLESLREVLKHEPAEEFLALIEKVVQSVEAGNSVEQYANENGMEKGVTGYVYQTVPIAIHVWLNHQTDFKTAIKSVIELGGDTDTTAAIVGGIVGSRVGKAGIPTEWLTNLVEWPRTTIWMERLAHQLHGVLHNKATERPLTSSYFATMFRNIVFITIIFAHIFRRMLPPY